ncbi:MAG: sensor histidine kinase [Methyloceanibacter sp.]|nr:sensor histidine kinase [Methyloceanibacter sp.]
MNGGLSMLSDMTAAAGSALVVVGILIVLGLLVYAYRVRKADRARDATRRRLEEDLERRTKELAEAERQFDAERSAREQQLRLLLRELTHRSKNLLAVIQAIARQTARQTASVDEFLNRFGARLHGIGMSHDLLIADDWQGASLRMLAEQQLETHLESPGKQVTIEGEDVVLKPAAVHNLGMALHELTANAEKYGALSRPEGTVNVRWQVCEDEKALKLTWEELGGPEVTKPSRSGFGRAMIENIVSQALSGCVALTFPAEGVRCEIVIPTSHITSRG